MRYPHGLQLDIGVESDPFEDIGCQRLVGVVAKPALEVGEVEVSVWSGVEVAKHTAFAPAVPHSVARPLGCLGLADGDGLAAGAIDAGRGNPGGELISNRGEVCERGLEPSLGLSPAKSLAPARYWPIMKIMWAAATRTAQSTLIWPSMADRVGPEVCRPTAVKPSRCASTRTRGIQLQPKA